MPLGKLDASIATVAEVFESVIWPLVRTMVWPESVLLKVMTDAVPEALANAMACRREPTPESAVVQTRLVGVATSIEPSSIRLFIQTRPAGSEGKLMLVKAPP